MKIEFTPIGFIKTETENIPRHWTVSAAEGSIVIDGHYKEGLKDIKAGQRIVVLFYFHQSPRFTPDLLAYLKRPVFFDQALIIEPNIEPNIIDIANDM
jgi:tRNA (Thr-GGU) A37 N-methylase